MCCYLVEFGTVFQESGIINGLDNGMLEHISSSTARVH